MAKDKKIREVAMPRRIPWYAVVLVVAVGVLGAYFAYRISAGPTGAMGPAPVPGASVPQKRTLAAINKAVAQLVGQPPVAPTPFARVLAVRQAIRDGDFHKGDRVLHAVLHQSRIGPWAFAPFSGFLAAVTKPAGARFARGLNAWVQADRGSAMAHLVRASYYLHLGWWIRGHDAAAYVLPHNTAAFVYAVDLARKDIRASLAEDPRDPAAWALGLLILRDAAGNAAQRGLFEEAIRIFPDYYPLYRIRLAALQPKWFGSLNAMYAFVHRYAGPTSASSPRRLLYLQMYADVLSAVSDACSDNGRVPMNACVDVLMRRVATRHLDAAAFGVFGFVRGTGRQPFAAAVRPILSSMIMTTGGGRFSGIFLEGAAHALGSDTQLVASDTGGNNYVIDRLAALVWYEEGQFANARTLYRRALADLANTRFSGPDAEDAARAQIYTDLASTYNRLHAYRKVAIYEKAASILYGGDGARPGYDAVECNALFRLGLYAEAVRTCKAIVRNDGSLQTRYWLGRVYAAMNRKAAALRAYRLVAGSESMYRSYAAITIGVIDDQAGDLQGALKSLKTYPYLFSTRYVGAPTVALAYNNLCYNEMHLHELHRALKACAASLHYGHLPDAYAKEQELLQMLRAG